VFVTLLGCAQWLYLGNCFVCYKAARKLCNPRGWHLQEIFRIDVLPERVLPLHDVRPGRVFSPSLAAVFEGGGGHAIHQSHMDFQWWPHEGHVQGFILLIVNMQCTWNLFFLLAPFSSDSNVNAQSDKASNGLLQLSLPFKEMFVAYGQQC